MNIKDSDNLYSYYFTKEERRDVRDEHKELQGLRLRRC